MAAEKNSFILYADILPMLEKLPDDKAGLLFKTILRYVNDLNPTLDDFVVDIAFEPIKQQLKRDLRHWEGIKVKRSEAGKASAEAKKAAKMEEQKSTKSTSVESVEQSSTHSTVSVNVNGNVSVTDTVKKKDKSISLSDKSDYPKCMDLYNSFIQAKTGAGAKVTAATGKALKSIIAYLEKNITSGTVPEVFALILENHNLWEPFLQKQLKMEQIDSNLINIMSSIRNGKSNTAKNGRSMYAPQQ